MQAQVALALSLEGDHLLEEDPLEEDPLEAEGEHPHQGELGTGEAVSREWKLKEKKNWMMMKRISALAGRGNPDWRRKKITSKGAKGALWGSVPWQTQSQITGRSVSVNPLAVLSAVYTQSHCLLTILTQRYWPWCRGNIRGGRTGNGLSGD